jgi:hypothetical protein
MFPNFRLIRDTALTARSMLSKARKVLCAVALFLNELMIKAEMLCDDVVEATEMELYGNARVVEP